MGVTFLISRPSANPLDTLTLVGCAIFGFEDTTFASPFFCPVDCADSVALRWGNAVIELRVARITSSHFSLGAPALQINKWSLDVVQIMH